MSRSKGVSPRALYVTACVLIGLHDMVDAGLPGVEIECEREDLMQIITTGKARGEPEPTDKEIANVLRALSQCDSKIRSDAAPNN